MTRINVGVEPTELPNRLLLAEHREIVRIPNMIWKSQRLSKIPDCFTLGTGHVRFFYNKLSYLRRRYDALYAECCRRGFNVTYMGESFDDLPQRLYGNYEPTDSDRSIIVDRIRSKGFELFVPSYWERCHG